MSIFFIFVIISFTVTLGNQFPEKNISSTTSEPFFSSKSYHESPDNTTATLDSTNTSQVYITSDLDTIVGDNVTYYQLAFASKTNESATPTSEPVESVAYYYESFVTTTPEPSVVTSIEPPGLFQPTLMTTFEPSVTLPISATYEPSVAESTFLPSENSDSSTAEPFMLVTSVPTLEPTNEPSFDPSFKSYAPTLVPTLEPTTGPALSLSPSLQPLFKPSFKPTLSVKPSAPPLFPSYKPMSNPTLKPSKMPTYRPTTTAPITPAPSVSSYPTVDLKAPTRIPTSVHAKKTKSPVTFLPTIKSTFAPTLNETIFPTVSPTVDSSNFTIVINPYDVPGLSQNDEAAYLATWSAMIKDSYTEPLPINFDATCLATFNSYTSASTMQPITLNGNFSVSTFQNSCGTSNLCILAAGSTLTMDGNLNVAALLIRGTLVWTDSTQTSPQQWLCAGYVVVEEQGSFIMNMASPNLKSYIFLKDNGATHPSSLQTRVFGAHSKSGSSFPTIDVSGRPLARTWSLLAVAATAGVSSVTLLHDPVAMGWQVGDRIVIAPMAPRSQGTAQWFSITGMSSSTNQITLSSPTNQNFNAQISATGSNVALMSAEVINLSRYVLIIIIIIINLFKCICIYSIDRNIIITGDDFRHIPCTNSLPGPFSVMGCNCNPAIGRTQCTLGLHTVLSGPGLMRMQYIRVEKAGQRGIRGKYPLHLHYVNKCPDCLFQGNAVEFSQQRGIIVHETHLASVVDNVLNDVRGAGLFIEDGNEMYNKFMYNVVICPWAKSSTTKHGCTVAGTDNGQADTTLNQAGIWSLTPVNYLVGNRFANSFNGMFYDTGSSRNGQQGAKGLVDTLFTPVLRVEGNTLHGHGRFGSYILQYWGKNASVCLPNLDLNGQLLPNTCTGFTSDGLDNGGLHTFSSNVDYSNTFVGGYQVGNLQYQNHVARGNFNNIYWKESNDFVDGCSAHITNSDYQDGNIALPDMAAFIIENTLFTGQSKFESAHHCNVGVTGYICMPMFILSNVQWKSVGDTWVVFHNIANYYGGIFVLPPSEAVNNTGAGGFFPAGYQSMVFGSRDYLLAFGNDTCHRTNNMDNAFPGQPGSYFTSKFSSDSGKQGAIFCTKPLRSLKIYTTGLDLSDAYTYNKNGVISKYTVAFDLKVTVYNNTSGDLITSFVVPFHQIGSHGSDTSPNKQVNMLFLINLK